MTGLRMRIGPEIKLRTGYKFKRAVDCNLIELESVLDRYAPPAEQKGWWPHNPVAPDPVDTYRACYETILKIDPDTEFTMAQYIRRALADKEEGSAEILKLTKTLAKYLQENEGEER